MIGWDAVSVLASGTGLLGMCAGYFLGWHMRGEQEDMNREEPPALEELDAWLR